ncbi:MAG: hypothetical protein ABH828_00755 [archaeon]
MSIPSRDFLIASGDSFRTTVKVKKDGKIDSFSFETTDSKEELNMELEKAEKILKTLKGKLSKNKLKIITGKIRFLRTQIGEYKEELRNHPLEHKGEVITPPIFEDLYHELDELDAELNIPTRKKEKEISEMDELPMPPSSLLDIPPPPEK